MSADLPDLHHHGDSDVRPGMVDLAVNVRVTSPPAWLADVIRDSITDLGAYPDATAATRALAAHHGVPPEMVLPTAGGAEAFTLVARAIPGEPVVVHPQFTEPDTALRAAGRTPRWVVLDAEEGFGLGGSSSRPQAVSLGERAPGHRAESSTSSTEPSGSGPLGPTCGGFGTPDGRDGEIVFVGNPTNPTGTLHRAADLRTLAVPGRTLVVDEAFMDAVPDEPESLIGPHMRGILVLRSLTKTWGLAGLRAGYVVGDPGLVAQLRQQQPHWSVSTPALKVMEAVATRRGRAETLAAAKEFDRRRAYALARLRAVDGVHVAGQPRTPFLLLRTRRGVRESLHTHGFAVRRGDTFPGLGPEWIRIAVRDEATVDAFADALARTLCDDPSTTG
ncbi:aminotransferase class I/II-fold pyridoxal phosphate-dependent enzyme [Mariniluteicoccus endophyticus]